jgi:RecA-superfamily ATPases implicated in signal transduction
MIDDRDYIEPAEDLSDPHRYDSAERWDPYKKQRKAAAKLLRDWGSEPGDPFRVLNGNDLAKAPTLVNRPAQLFGNLWTEGEVAALFGQTATGKSILATQIAESIARGIASSIENSDIYSKQRSQPVLYFDFERSLAQFLERYSVPRSSTSGRRIKYRFFKNFSRLDLGYIEDVADEIKGDLNLFLRNAVQRQIRESRAKVVVIDNISFLSRGIGNGALTGLMKTLKLWASLYGVSILAISSVKSRRKTGAGFNKPAGEATSMGWFGGVGKPITLADLPPYAAVADSIFTIAPSSISADIRYIKHLKSSRTTLGSTHDSGAVIVLRLERLSEPGAIAGECRSPHDSKGVLLTGTTQISTTNSPNSQLPDCPFLGFTHLGYSAEAEHLRDYEREARDAHDREQKKLRAWHDSAKEALVQGYFDGSYARYLKGD